MMQKKVTYLIVGQTPPPFHGQSVATLSLVEGLKKCDAVRFLRMAYSERVDDVGGVSVKKLLHLFGLVRRCWREVFLFRPVVLYYLPASANVVPVLRDVVFLTLVRPFVRGTVYHFHAGGVADFLRRRRILRWISFFAYQWPTATIELYKPVDGGMAELLAPRIVRYVPNGVAEPPEGVLGKKRENLWITSKRLEITFLGNLYESKGVMDALKVMRRLRDMRVVCRLRLVGACVDAVFLKRCEDFVEKKKLGDYVVFCGAVSGEEKWEVLRGTDVLFFPTYYGAENLPLVVLEAFACGVAVVSTNWRGIPSVIQDGVNGFLCEPGDVEGFAKKLKMLCEDAELRRDLSKNARSAYEENYRVEKFRESVFGVLCEAREIV